MCWHSEFIKVSSRLRFFVKPVFLICGKHTAVTLDRLGACQCQHWMCFILAYEHILEQTSSMANSIFLPGYLFTELSFQHDHKMQSRINI